MEECNTAKEVNFYKQILSTPQKLIIFLSHLLLIISSFSIKFEGKTLSNALYLYNIR